MTPDDVAKKVIETIRSRDPNYGNPGELFPEIARRWGQCEDRTTVAMKMAELKMARLCYQWDEDSAIDAIAYLAFAVMFASED